MRRSLLLAASILALATTSTLADEKEFPAKLVGHAILPANTIIKAPEDAPAHLKTSGKFSTADRTRAEGFGTVPGKDGVRLTGLSLPFDGQPVQGFSGIKADGDGTFWSLSDNGFGNEAEFLRRGAHAAPAEVRLGRRQGRSPEDDLPERSRQEGSLPDRASKAARSATSPAPTSTSNRSSRSPTASGSATNSAPTC